MSRILVILSLSTCLGVAPAGLLARPLDAIRPNILVPSDSSPIPGETVTYTVSLSGAASAAGYMTISSSTLSNFASLPSEASYNAGDSTVTFSGTVATTASGALQVSASNSGGVVSAYGTVEAGSISFRF